MNEHDTLLICERKEAQNIVQRPCSDIEDLRRQVGLYKRIFDSACLVVGHEFSKPLTAASGYLELLEERLGAAIGQKERRYIAKIGEALDRLGELVETFVEMLRAENGDLNLRALERFEVASLIEQVKSAYGERAERVTVEELAAVQALVGNRRCIEIVLDNLLSNALKHGGGKQISVKAAVQSSEKDSARSFLVLSVEDRGEGIPKEKLRDVFTPFFRLGGGSGLGLGLALVKSLLDVIGGEVVIESEEGRGTTVTVKIPVFSDSAAIPDIVG